MFNYLNFHFMETNTINRVEILGRVGAEPRITNAGSSRIARFPVATNELFKDRGGGLHEETTWHNVAAWPGRSVPAFDDIKKGVMVHVYGRIRNSKYTGPEGEDKYFSEINASHIDICREEQSQGPAPVGYR